jgi:hypothetical protein
MNALRLIGWGRGLVFFLMCLSPRLFAEAPECAAWGGVQEAQALHFLEFDVETSAQRTLLDTDSAWGPTWMQVVFENSELRFENKMQGLGLPFTVYHVKVDWLSPNGVRVAAESFPSDNRCEPLSLFPGGVSQSLPLRRPAAKEALRLRIRVWSAGF